MTDTTIVRIGVPKDVQGQDLPYKKIEDTEPTGEIKSRSATSCVPAPFNFQCGTAKYWITPLCKYIDGKLVVIAYELSVSIPGAVCGLNALIQNEVHAASLLALYFFQYWLLDCGVPTETVKKFSLKNCELQELHLTYLAYSKSKLKANSRILELAQRGLTFFSGDLIKKNKRKPAVDYRNSDWNCYVTISKSSKFDIAAYVKSWVIPKSFCGLSNTIAEDIFKLSQNYVRFEVKLKKPWFKETVTVVDADGRTIKKKQPSKWASPLSWKGKAGMAMYEKVFEEAREFLRLNEKLNKRRHRPDFMKTLSDEHREILEKHYVGTPFKDLPFKSKDKKQRSKVKRAIQKLCGVDLHIPWEEQKELVQLPWLVYPGMFKLDVVPEALKDHAFAGSTIKKKLEQMKEKLRALAKRNDSYGHTSNLNRAPVRYASDMTEAELASDLMGTV